MILNPLIVGHFPIWQYSPGTTLASWSDTECPFMDGKSGKAEGFDKIRSKKVQSTVSGSQSKKQYCIRNVYSLP